MYHFCTYFDQNYLSRGLALYRSLQEHCAEFRLFVLCMDGSAYRTLNALDLPGVHAISLEEFERNDQALRQAKQNRSRIEYYFTCTPSLCLYVLANWPDVDLVTYLDADLFFFASPAPLFEELGDGSIGIIGHRFPARLRDRERYGLYNVGWLNFRRNENAAACLRWWREWCLEWCYDREDNGRFADQKYLDDWQSRFRNVVVLEHQGANVAPWNVDSDSMHSTDNTVMVGSHPLIFFHFHGLKQIGRWLFDPGWKEYGIRPTAVLRREVYLPYIRVLSEVGRTFLSRSKTDSIPEGVRVAVSQPKIQSPLRRVISRIRLARTIAGEIVAGSLIVFVIKA